MLSLKSFTPAFVSVLLATCLRAQNPNLDFKNSIVGYNLSTFEIENATWTSARDQLNHWYNKTVLQILHPTIAYRWRTKKRNFQELELTKLSLRRTDFQLDGQGQYMTHTSLITKGYVVVSTNLQLRYEYMFTFNKKNTSKWVPALGLGAKTYLNRSDYKNSSAHLFPFSTLIAGIQAEVIPRLAYFFRERIFFDINVPVSLFFTQYEYSKNQNPAIPTAYRHIYNYNSEAIPAVLSLRCGVGIKL